MSQSGLIINGKAQASLFVCIVLERRLLVNLDTSIVYRYIDSLNINDLPIPPYP